MKIVKNFCKCDLCQKTYNEKEKFQTLDFVAKSEDRYCVHRKQDICSKCLPTLCNYIDLSSTEYPITEYHLSPYRKEENK